MALVQEREADRGRLPRCAGTGGGGKYADIPADKAHVDGNLVTAPAWPAPPDWLAKFLKVLGTKIDL